MLNPKIPFSEGVAKMVAEIEKWNDAPLWDQQRIAQATETWFKYLS